MAQNKKTYVGILLRPFQVRHDRSILCYTKNGDILPRKEQEKLPRSWVALNNKPYNSLSCCHGNDT